MSTTLTPQSRGRLINLKTNLKSLRFGGDRPAGGSSNQPYIVKDIPEGTDYGRDGMPLRSGPDFILRDGFLAPIKAITDISRLAQMFIDIKSPRGLFFTLKQNLLSKASVKTQASFGLGYFGGAMNQGAYLPIGTLLDAGLGWAGIHLNKNGINPVGSLGGPAGANRNARGGAGALNPYSVVVQNNQSKVENRLVDFESKISRGKSGKYGSNTSNPLGQAIESITEGIANFKVNPEATSDNPDTPVLYSYSGGPGSILGIGKTNIFKDRPTYNAIRNYKNLSINSPGYNGVQPSGLSPLLHGDSLRLYSESELTTRRGLYPRSFINFLIDSEIEFDEESGVVVSRIIHKAPDYTTQNKSQRLSMGDPGAAITYAADGTNKVRNVFNYGIAANEMEALDKLTALKMYEGATPDASLPIDDLVRFNIAVISNEPDKKGIATYLHFRAYINGFTDNYAATWNDTQYVGRGNSFKSYGGFSRNISMGFTVMATSKAELIPMMTKLNFLASSLAPDYGLNGFMKGNMVRMTVGGYLYEVPGVLTSITYTIPDDTTWEIAIDERGGEDVSVKELPHRIEVSLAFTPVEDFLPSLQKLGYDPNTGELTSVGPQHFISLASARGDNYDGVGVAILDYVQPNSTKLNLE
jgi:hypothetical protein